MEAEKQFVRAVMQPFLEARFTPGIVDGGQRGSSQGLGALLKELLEYVKEVAGDALEAAEEMLGTPPAPLPRDPGRGGEGRRQPGQEAAAGQGSCDVAPLPVDLVCNGVWRPVQQVLMTRLSSIFATGMMATQRTNYMLCMEFLEGLSRVCGEGKWTQVRRRLLAHPSVVEFKARWNLPIYFQLRSREISARLEAALSSIHGRGGGVMDIGEDDEASLYEGPGFELPVFRKAWVCLSRCWDPEVYLPSLAHRFLRLTLQGIGRIGAWAGSAEVLALPSDDIVPVASDLDKLLLCLQNELVAIAARRLSEPAAGERHRDGRGAMEEGDARELLEEAVREGVGEWGMLVGNLWEKTTSQVAEQCMAMLQAIKGITATYRMTNKPPPHRPSPFVPNVLRALREFDQRWGVCATSKDEDQKGADGNDASVVVAAAPGEDGERVEGGAKGSGSDGSASGSAGGDGAGRGAGGGGWKQRVVLAVCERYLEIVSELLLTVRQMENTLNKRRVTARRGSRAGGADQGPSDKDKIMMQLRLDVAEFGREAAQLGVDLTSTKVFGHLLDVVEATSEEPSTGA